MLAVFSYLYSAPLVWTNILRLASFGYCLYHKAYIDLLLHPVQHLIACKSENLKIKVCFIGRPTYILFECVDNNVEWSNLMITSILVLM